MFDNRCRQFWSKAAYLPVETVLDYWCNGQGPDCREAKKYALITACERGDVEYQRTDGKNFNDPVLDLIGREILVIQRESFEKWAEVTFDPDRQQTFQAPYLDSKHKFYSAELALAVNTWLAVYDAGGSYRPGKCHKEQIEAAMDKRNQSDWAVKRITTVVNPNKDGGAPATPSWTDRKK